MSRGLGKTQRYALEYLAAHGEGTVEQVARAYTASIATTRGSTLTREPNVNMRVDAYPLPRGPYTSMARALHRLWEQGLVVRREKPPKRVPLGWRIYRMGRDPGWVYSLPTSPASGRGDAYRGEGGA
jgi:hypothetical protein